MDDFGFEHTVKMERMRLDGEQLRLEDQQHKREMRTISFVSVCVVTSLIVFVLLVAKGCSAGAERAQEARLACIAAGGSWTVDGGDGQCAFGKSND